MTASPGRSLGASPFLPLTDGELELMRATQAATMTTPAVRIRTEDDGDDGQGGTIEGPERRDSFLCRPVPISNRPGDVVEGDAQVSRVDQRILFAYGADIRPGDRLEVLEVGYSVVFVDGGKGEALETVAYCRALASEGESKKWL